MPGTGTADPARDALIGADDESRVPVIIGVGQVNDRPEDPAQGLDSLGLMAAALRVADRDAGGGWLAALDSLAVVAQISFPSLRAIPATLARLLGATPRLCYETAIASGDSPILLMNEAANRIGAGEIEVAAVAGGEALRTAARRATVAGADGGSPSAARDASLRAAPSYRRRYWLVAPVDVYPLYENAGRAAYGQTLDEGQRESGEIWSRFSEIAAGNAGAWIKKPVSAEEVITPGADNRPITFPYTKLQVANSSVNQGAGFIITSLARARRHGIPNDRLVFIGQGAAAHEDDDFLARDRYDRSVSMEVSLRRALALNGITASDLDAVELYSCFPCVPKMARRVLDWPLDRPATLFGGLTFGGGPIGNYMSHAVVGLVERLRRGGRRGLLFANGGFATHNHTIVLSREPPPAGTFPQDFDFQQEADALRGPIPSLVEDYVGPGRIETYTVFYDRRGDARFGTVVALAPDGRRFLAKVPAADAAGIAFLTDGRREPVGSGGNAVAGADGDILWQKS